ncbi:MAG TPA: type IV toxin-antitoxin system AbiEi family antitoxin domain-containing protein [Acidimicrobiales bacterium]
MDHSRCGQLRTDRLFAAQHGVIGRQQAIAAGLTPRMIEWRVHEGAWLPVHRAVYRLAGAPATWQQRLMAATLATGGVASHRSAARLWGLDVAVTDRLDVMVVGTGGRSISRVALHRTRSLGGPDRAVREGISCTSVARTLVDLAAELEFDDLEAAVDSALREGLTTVSYLERWLPAQGRNGTAVLREIVNDRRVNRPFGSRREAQVSRMLVAAGLPRPVPQHELRDDQGRVVARFDLAWPAWRVAVEFASYRHHFGRQAWRHDASRANRATSRGWRILTATDLDVDEGCRRLATDVGRARAA